MEWINNLKVQKWLISLGLLGVIFFLAMDILGITFWREYNPITDYVSKFLAEEAPNVTITKTLMNLYNICFCLYALTMTLLAFRKYRILIKIGYITLFLLSILSLLGYGTIPISLDFIFSINNFIHLILTIFILCLAFLAILFLSIGYVNQSNLKKLGKICFICTICFLFFNILHIIAILNSWAALGLIERLIFYSFHILTSVISWAYIKDIALD